MTVSATLNLLVHAVRCEARDVLLIELRDPNGKPLPPFMAGAHLEVHLKDRMVRHYSLCNDPRETHRYCFGVGLARDSRGGSKLIHETLRVGQTLRLSLPRNNFPLAQSPEECVFVAGGIGITPIMSMIRTCLAEGRKWRLYYCTRNRVRTAFYEELMALPDKLVEFHFDDEQQGRLFDAAKMLDQVAADAHVYTCGPEPLMKAVAAAGALRPAERMHFEWFSAAPADTSTDREFSLRLVRSGLELVVPPDRSILDVLEDYGVGVPWSCREGLCATCRTDVISGECDHRDSVLSEAERASNKSLLVCVSRARSPVLELDL